MDELRQNEDEIAVLDVNLDRFIEEQIESYEKIRKKDIPRETHLESLREKFVDDFKMKKIMDLSKEEYVVGFHRNDSFCYRIETELRELGNFKGATAPKFGLYYSQKKGKYVTSKDKFGEDPDEALEKIKEQIVLLMVAGENDDDFAIKKSLFPPTFRGKILSTYFPERYLNIFSDVHLSFFLNKLGIAVLNLDDELSKQRKLYNWKNHNAYMEKWSLHEFVKFLYHAFGRPLDFNFKGQIEEMQKDMDKEYPRKHVMNVKINQDEWQMLLEDKDIFFEKDIDLVKRIYQADNHATTCYELGLEKDESPSSYIKPAVALARRISSAINLEPIKDKNGKETWTPILFWGKYRDNGHFEWKLQPKLAKALAHIYSELDYLKNEGYADAELIEDIKNYTFSKVDPDSAFRGKPKEKQSPMVTNGRLSYPRDRRVAQRALARASFTCEIDKRHPTFKRKNSNVDYTEPHHLIPMAYSDRFKVSLDVEENIISLCSNCHNQIHYGQGADELLRKLYEERNEELKKVGINIDFNDLIEMYR